MQGGGQTSSSADHTVKQAAATAIPLSKNIRRGTTAFASGAQNVIHKAFVQTQKTVTSTKNRFAKEVSGFVDKAINKGRAGSFSRLHKGPTLISVNGELTAVEKLTSNDPYAKDAYNIIYSEDMWSNNQTIQRNCLALCYCLTLGGPRVQSLVSQCALPDFDRELQPGRGHSSESRCMMLKVISVLCRLHKENQNDIGSCGLLRTVHDCLDELNVKSVQMWAAEALFFALINNGDNQSLFMRMGRTKTKKYLKQIRTYPEWSQFQHNRALGILDMLFERLGDNKAGGGGLGRGAGGDGLTSTSSGGTGSSEGGNLFSHLG